MAFLPHSIAEQIAAMRRDWPAFALELREDGDLVVWRGTLKPGTRTYTVEIVYGLEQVFLGPHVRVISPRLTRLPGNAEGSLPHVYNRETDPMLCLFDPKGEQWSGWQLVSRTTVPWAIDWLACYEFWLMTGVWEGGGRHPPSTGRRFNTETAP